MVPFLSKSHTLKSFFTLFWCFFKNKISKVQSYLKELGAVAFVVSMLDEVSIIRSLLLKGIFCKWSSRTLAEVSNDRWTVVP